MRNTRKILIALLVLMTILMSLVVVAIPASAAEETVRVYCNNNANWADVYCYTWDASTNTPVVAWPGTKVETVDENGLYYFDIPVGNKCIFNNNAGKQSPDLEIPANGKLVYTNGDKVVYVDVTVAKWTTVNCYYWGGDTNTWPGTKMEKVSDYLWKCTVPGGAGNIIFNNGSNQTVDLTAPAFDGAVYTLGDKDNNKYKATIHYHSFADATCTEPAKCECGATDGEALGHTWTDATCTAPKTCSVCETTEGEALGHSFEEGACSVCNAPDPDYVAPETPDVEECEHEFEENVFWHPELVQATCYAPGVAVFECIYCDYYYTEETPVDPEAHAFWGEEETITEANCATKTNGLKKVACANGCGEFDEVEISYYEVHNWDVQKESYATCTEAGEYYAVCTLCGEVDEYTNDANGHYNWLISCGETGECMECGEEFFKDHDWYVTCTEAAFCVNCFAEGAAAPGHTWVDATCTDPKTCSVCEETEGEALGHTYYYNLCLTCYGPNPYFENNYATVGENKLVCNEYHLVDTEGHGFPYQFTLMTIPADGIYAFTTPNLLSITVFTTAVTADNLADFEVGGPGWAAYDTDGIVELKAGTYYIGYIFAAGVGEYTMNISLHEHTFEEGKCVCGAENPDYVAPEQPAPEQPAPEQPAPEVELTLVQQIMKTLSELIAKITAWFKSFVGGLKK